MAKREFAFELKEISSKKDSKMLTTDIVTYTSGMVLVDEDGDIAVMIEDDSQPFGYFNSKDKLFNRIIKKIHETTNRRKQK